MVKLRNISSASSSVRAEHIVRGGMRAELHAHVRAADLHQRRLVPAVRVVHLALERGARGDRGRQARRRTRHVREVVVEQRAVVRRARLARHHCILQHFAQQLLRLRHHRRRLHNEL